MTMCRTFRQEFLGHVMTTLHREFLLKSASQHIIVYSQWVQYFYLFLCGNVCTFPRASIYASQPTLTARTGPQGQEVCVFMQGAHMCASTCMCVSVFSNIPTLHCSRLYSTCHHTRQEIVLCARGGVFPKEVPEQTVVVQTLAFITPEYIKHRWIRQYTVKMILKKFGV